MSIVKQERDNIVDQAERLILESGDPVTLPLKHRFTDGMYIREIFMPAGTVLTSRIHKTNHPFSILKGKCNVYDGDDLEVLEAPHIGITEKNTRRLIHVLSDTIWVTYHVTDKTNLEDIEKELLVERENPLVDQEKYEEFHEQVKKDNTFINKENGGKLCHSQQ